MQKKVISLSQVVAITVYLIVMLFQILALKGRFLKSFANDLHSVPFKTSSRTSNLQKALSNIKH